MRRSKRHKINLRQICTLLFFSPVAVLERHVRMRGRRTPLLLGIATGLPILFFLFRLHSLWPLNLTPAEYLRWSAATGHRLFLEIMTLEALLILLLMPALMAGTIAGERWSGRWEALALTTLSNQSILMGKLGSVLEFVLFMLSCAIPVAAMAFILGGISPLEVLACLLLIIVSAVLQGVLGLYTSTGASSVAVAVA